MLALIPSIFAEHHVSDSAAEAILSAKTARSLPEWQPDLHPLDPRHHLRLFHRGLFSLSFCSSLIFSPLDDDDCMPHSSLPSRLYNLHDDTCAYSRCPARATRYRPPYAPSYPLVTLFTQCALATGL